MPEPAEKKPASDDQDGPDVKLFAIIAAVVVVIVVVIAFVVPSLSKSGGDAASGAASPSASTPGTDTSTDSATSADASSTSATSADTSSAPSADSTSASSSSATEPEPAPEPQDGLTPEERRAFFEGKWVAIDSSDPKRPAGWFASAAAEGVYFTILLWDDGTGVFRTADGPEKITWEADSVTSGTTKVNGRDMTITLRSKKLTLTDTAGVELYFVPESEVDMSNAVDLSQHGNGVTVDPSTIVVGEYSKLIGNESVGYLQIPKNWSNYTDNLDEESRKTYAGLYYADPYSEYTSPSKGGPSYSLSVQVSRHSASYRDIAAQLYQKYTSDSDYGETYQRNATFGKRRAIIVETVNLVDGVNEMRVVLDRDNDEKVTVVLAYNCGSAGDAKRPEWCLGYSETWQVE